MHGPCGIEPKPMIKHSARRMSCPSSSCAQSIPELSSCGMSRLKLRIAAWMLVAALLLPRIAAARQAETNSPTQVFAGALARLVAIFQPPTNAPSRTFTATLKILKADGVSEEVAGHEFEVAEWKGVVTKK